MRLNEDGWFVRTDSEADGANPTDFGDEDAVPVVIEDQPTERLPRESNEDVVRGGLR